MVFFLVKYIYSITLTAMTPQTYKPIFYNFCSTPQGTKTIKPEVDKEWKPKSATHLHQTILHNQDSKLIKKKKKSGGGGGCLGRKERNREMTIKIQNPIDFRQCDRDTHALSHREKIKMSLEQSSSKSKTQVWLPPMR